MQINYQPLCPAKMLLIAPSGIEICLAQSLAELLGDTFNCTFGYWNVKNGEEKVMADELLIAPSGIEM